MANFSQKLRHGKALCARVFAGFVDTFNALVDFKDNLKGDDDIVRGVGRIRVDRNDPAHPVIRCSGCSASDSSGSSSTTVKPWSFSCTVGEDEDGEETRTGGWSNCRMQIGYDASFGDDRGTNRDLCKDGVYYAEVDLDACTWDLKCVETSNTDGASSRSSVPTSDFGNNKVNVFIGTVKDAKCTYSIHCIPVVYKYV